jgi:hypothetical protein
VIDNFGSLPAGPGDGQDIARLFALVQRKHTLGLTIWSSPRASAFVEDVIAGEKPELGMRYFKLAPDFETEGAICFRATEGRLFVDNVYVSPRLRRMQAAARFILDSTLCYLKDFNYQESAWDVWSDERALIAWYRNLGGVEQYRRSWFALPLPEKQGPAGEVVGREEAERIHARYGFSNVEVVTSQGRYRCGLLGSHAFRITDDRAVSDPEFLAALASIDRNRTMYVFSGNQELAGADNVVATVIRMHSAVGRFCGSLARSVPSAGAIR